ncbi:DUF3265 domain-containing protein, partial [Vibrio anguillarum]|nr:DUF3265 domain-containing protein [Vibrio anguillarum]
MAFFENCAITNNLRRIPNAWHFASTSILVFTVQCF